jgi:hypothetical protein
MNEGKEIKFTWHQIASFQGAEDLEVIFSFSIHSLLHLEEQSQETLGK